MFFTLIRKRFIAIIFFILSSNLFFSISSAELVPSDAIHINEFLPNPVGDDSQLEFIELMNTTDQDLDVSGWAIDTGGTAHFSINAGTSIAANSFLTFFSAQQNISLTNSGDHIQLIRPDAFVQDDITYATSKEGYSYIRTGADIYEETHIPTPNATNSLSASPMPTSTPAVTVAPTTTPLLSPIPSATVLPITYSSEIHVSEFLPNPTGDDGELEFVEIYNSSALPIPLSGWIINTGTTSIFSIPVDIIIGAGEYLAFFSSVYDISLSNSSDHIKLVRPDSIVQDDISYTTSKEGYSYNRLANGTYEQSFTPTANASNSITVAPTPTPKPTAITTEEADTESLLYDYSSHIVINELLPNPKGSDETGEYIEIKSLDAKPVNLFGWTLDDSAKGSGYHFPKSAVIGSKKIVAFYRNTTKVALNNDTDILKLIDPNGKVISQTTYAKPVPENQSFNRDSKGLFIWSAELTPHKENIITVQENSPADSGIKPASKLAAIKASHVPTVLAARTEMLAWPEIVSSSVPASQKVSPAYNSKQYAFMFFGAAMAVLQLVSGIFRKESIWRR